jgi:hypothetical protein
VYFTITRRTLRVAGVSVCHRNSLTSAFHGFGNRRRIGQRVRQRLVDDDIEASLQRCNRRGGMHMVGGNDGDCFNPYIGGQ